MTSEVRQTCTGCGHLAVCIIFRTIAPATKQLFPEGTTILFQPEDLARICVAYVSKTILANLTTLESTPEAEKK